MLRVTLSTPEHLVFDQTEVPSPGKGEVLIRIRRVGICGSDIHAYYGKHPTVFLPVVQGHEFSGTITALGEGADRFRPGMAVTVRPQLVCGECYYCRHGHENVCSHLRVLGCQVPGAAQEYLCVPQNLVIPLPDGMSFDDGAMVEPVAVAVSAVRAFQKNIKGKNILVLGAGTIGNLTAQAAKGLGAASVTVTDLSDAKLEIARECGIDFTVNPRKEDLEKALERNYGVDGLDGALECVGVEATINQAIRVCRKESEIIVVGVYAQRPAIDMIDVQEKELRLTGTLMYLEEDWRIALDLIQNGKIRLDPLKSAGFPLGEYDKAYRYIEQHADTAMKVLIRVAD